MTAAGELPCRNLALEGSSASASGCPGGYGGHLQAKSRGYVKINKTQRGQDLGLKQIKTSMQKNNLCHLVDE